MSTKPTSDLPCDGDWAEFRAELSAAIKEIGGLRLAKHDMANKLTTAMFQIATMAEGVRDLKESVASLASSVASVADTVRVADGRAKKALRESDLIEKQMNAAVTSLTKSSDDMSKAVKDMGEWVAEAKKASQATPDQAEWWLSTTPQKIAFKYPFRALAFLIAGASSLVGAALIIMSALGPSQGIRLLLGLNGIPAAIIPAPAPAGRATSEPQSVHTSAVAQVSGS